MGEYEPNDSRNVTGTASTNDGRWTGEAKNDPTRADHAQRNQQQMQQQGGRPTQAGAQQAGGHQFDQDVQFDGGSGSRADIERQMNQSGGAGSQMGGGQMGGQFSSDQGSNQGFAEPFTAQEASQSGQQNQSNLGTGQMGGASDTDDGGIQFTPDPKLIQAQQEGQSVGQPNQGVSGVADQLNDQTSGIGQEQQFDSGSLGQQGGASGTSRFVEQVAKDMEVVDPSGQHLGTVDSIEGDRIKLTRKDSPDGQHHYVDLSQVEGIEGGKVRLSTGATSV